jgi:hypothetical protein
MFVMAPLHAVFSAAGVKHTANSLLSSGELAKLNPGTTRFHSAAVACTIMYGKVAFTTSPRRNPVVIRWALRAYSTKEEATPVPAPIQSVGSYGVIANPPVSDYLSRP